MEKWKSISFSELRKKYDKIFNFGGFHEGRGMPARYKEAFIKSNYKEIKPGSLVVKEEEFVLNAAGIISICFSYENRYDYYYPTEIGKEPENKWMPIIPEQARKEKIEGGWVGDIFISREVKVLNTPSDKYSEELEAILKRLIEGRVVKSKELSSAIAKGPGFASDYFIKSIDKIPAKDRIMLIKSLCENVDRGDGFRVMEMVYKLYFDGKDLKDKEREAIEETLKRGIEGIRIKELRRYYEFNEEAAKKISSCILEKEREVNANQE